MDRDCNSAGLDEGTYGFDFVVVMVGMLVLG